MTSWLRSNLFGTDEEITALEDKVKAAKCERCGALHGYDGSMQIDLNSFSITKILCGDCTVKEKGKKSQIKPGTFGE